MKLIPYMMFYNGACREAFEFYAGALGGQVVSVVTYGDMPAAPGQPPLPDAARSQIANAHLMASGASIMGSDGSETIDGRNDTSVNVDVATIEEAERVFNALSAGGQVTMPLAETSWSHRFGMFDDRYGKPWMVNCLKPMP